MVSNWLLVQSVLGQQHANADMGTAKRMHTLCSSDASCFGTDASSCAMDFGKRIWLDAKDQLNGDYWERTRGLKREDGLHQA